MAETTESVIYVVEQFWDNFSSYMLTKADLKKKKPRTLAKSKTGLKMKQVRYVMFVSYGFLNQVQLVKLPKPKRIKHLREETNPFVFPLESVFETKLVSTNQKNHSKSNSFWDEQKIAIPTEITLVFFRSYFNRLYFWWTKIYLKYKVFFMLHFEKTRKNRNYKKNLQFKTVETEKKAKGYKCTIGTKFRLQQKWS